MSGLPNQIADNEVMAERLIMERLVKGKAPGREFDIQFWQKLGPSQIFAARGILS